MVQKKKVTTDKEVYDFVKNLPNTFIVHQQHSHAKCAKRGYCLPDGSDCDD